MLSAIIIAKNEEKMIQNCINSLTGIADEVVVIDNGSNDRTVEIALQNNAQVDISNETSFAKLRDIGAQKARGEWLLYIDADERVTYDLAEEIKEIINTQNPTKKYHAYVINRKDFYFGVERPLFSPMQRLFQKAALKGWHGDVHETATVDGQIGYITSYFLHFTHIDLNSMLTNTMRWSDTEAGLRFTQRHPPIVWWRLVRVAGTGFWNSFVTQQGYKCGTAGWIEALYQGFSLFITYAKLWELQNRDKIDQAYQNLESPYIKNNL
jgi:glycosyltransferase involved in cell wall biosynthesis